MAGFVVGIVDRPSILPRMDLMIPGDIVLGLPSSGVHSNGYSLVRHIVSLHGSNAYDAPCPFPTTIPGQTLGEALLTPTRIYVKSLLPIIRKGLVKGMSHITGGGFTENIPRVLPDHLSVTLDAKNWPLLPVFKWLKSTGGIENHELARTFNCGIGMVLVASKKSASIIIEILKSEGEAVFTLGQVVSSVNGSERVQIDNLEYWNQ